MVWKCVEEFVRIQNLPRRRLGAQDRGFEVAPPRRFFSPPRSGCKGEWRNGSASDSSPEGCGFKSRFAQHEVNPIWCRRLAYEPLTLETRVRVPVSEHIATSLFLPGSSLVVHTTLESRVWCVLFLPALNCTCVVFFGAPIDKRVRLRASRIARALAPDNPPAPDPK